MSDFTFSVDLDYSQLLQQFAKIPQEAQKAGQQAGKGLGDGMQEGAAKGAKATLDELNKVKSGIILQFKELKAQGADPTSAAYKALQEQLKQVNEQIKSLKVSPPDLPQATNNFRLLDGVVQGVAFSLSNALVNGASQAVGAINGLVNGYARLDTVIRQAAAASGGPGDYDKLASIIDRVGIEAAGTSDQVAGLSLELARGGMTADQQAAGLAGIVRGAEATATSYEQMGQIVSATLTSFGLEASETNRVVDALVQGANASATDVSGLGQAFKDSAPAAKLLGVSVEGLATAVGLFTNAGITAGEAGTALRNGLSQLAQAAPKNGQQLQGLTGQAKVAADTVKRLGLDIYTASGQLKPMETVLLQVKRAMAGMTAGEQTQIASALFGGLDDAAKWLAVISQGEEKIKAMAASMASAGGATDRNRDAMQGFQLTIQQLGGTVDSLGKNVGKVAAAGLLPLVNALNSVVGAISGLPGPVKDVTIGITLLTAAVLGAVTAYVVFKQVLAIGAVSNAITEVAALSKGIGQTFVSAIKAAVAAWPAFVAQASLANAPLSVFGASLKSTAVAIKTQFVAAMNAAGTSIGGMTAYLKSASFAQFIAGAKAALVALAPLALAIGAIVLAVSAFREVLASSDAVQEKFAGSQKEATDAQAALRKSLAETGQSLSSASAKADDTRNAFEKLFSQARQDMGMREITNQTLAQITAWDGVSNSVNKYIISIRGANKLSGEAATQAVAAVKAAQAGEKANAKRAAALREYADVAEAANRLDEARNARQNADTLDRVAESFRNQAQALQAKLAPAEREITLTKEQIQAINARRAAEEALNNTIAEAPVRSLDSRISLGQQLLSLSQAISQAEQSRFAVSKSALDFELKKAQERGASEEVIAGIKKRIEASDREALSARYAALLKEQALQRSILILEQQRAKAQAEISILQQQSAITKAKRELDKAQAEFGSASEQSAQALAELRTQEQILVYKQQELGILQQTQPLQAISLNYQQQAARNGMQSEAAANGYRFALDGSLRPANALVELQGRISTITRASAADQAQYTAAARQAGLAIGTAADGTIVLARSQQEVNTAVIEMNRQIGAAASGYDAATDSAGRAKGKTDELRSSLDQSQGPAQALVNAFIKAGEQAPSATQGARDFGAELSKARRFAEQIDGVRLDSRMAAVRDRTREAAGAAEDFYRSLFRSAGLPAARWTGGPVEAGADYRVNELGQEAFLSAGKLSLLDAAPNSIWRAPSDGVVIPAGVTARLQERAAIAIGTGSAGTAGLAIEVGKLRQEVGNLVRKNWNVNIQHRTGPTGSQVMRTLMS